MPAEIPCQLTDYVALAHAGADINRCDRGQVPEEWTTGGVKPAAAIYEYRHARVITDSEIGGHPEGTCDDLGGVWWGFALGF
jgi:hypothetical protein